MAIDFSAPFKRDTLHPLLTIIVPGAVAVAPYLVIANVRFAEVAQFSAAHGTAYSFIVLTIVACAGLVLEDLSSNLEWLWDLLLTRKNPNHLTEWRAYLRLQVPEDLVARRYLRRLVMRLKFELSMVPALFLAGIGLIRLQILRAFLEPRELVLVIVIFVILIGYSVFESFETAKLCDEVRRDVIHACSASSGKLNTTPAGVAEKILPATAGRAPRQLEPAGPPTKSNSE